MKIHIETSTGTIYTKHLGEGVTLSRYVEDVLTGTTNHFVNLGTEENPAYVQRSHIVAAYEV